MNRNLTEHLGAKSGNFEIFTRLMIDSLDTSWIADDYDSYLSGKKKRILLPAKFLDDLKSTFPPFGGGEMGYNEECKVDLQMMEGKVVCVREIIVRRDDLEVSWKMSP